MLFAVPFKDVFLRGEAEEDKEMRINRK